MFPQLKSFISLNPLLCLLNSKTDLFSLHLCFFLSRGSFFFFNQIQTEQIVLSVKLRLFSLCFLCAYLLHISWRLKQTRYGRNVAARLENVCCAQTRLEQHRTKKEGAQLFQEDIVQISGPPAQTQVVTSTPIQDGCIVDCILNVRDAQV